MTQSSSSHIRGTGGNGCHHYGSLQPGRRRERKKKKKDKEKRKRKRKKMSKKEQKRRREKKKEKKYHREQGRAKHDHGAKGTDEAEVNRSGLLVANPDVKEDGGQEDHGVHRVTSNKVLLLNQRD